MLLSGQDAERKAGGGTKAGRVLLAEDDFEMRRVLADALRSARFDVLEAADGRELIEQLSASILQRLPVDCIITDVCMPRMTGTQALRFIKARGISYPVIVITAFGDNASRLEAWLLGAVAVMDKPFSLLELMDELHRIGLGGTGAAPTP